VTDRLEQATIELRHPETDETAIEAMWERCSPATRYGRIHSPSAVLPAPARDGRNLRFGVRSDVSDGRGRPATTPRLDRSHGMTGGKRDGGVFISKHQGADRQFRRG